ncbi:VVA0879 family protein [Sphingomonas hankookensis]|uniref:Uncharacterized protein n=1 Tax=Sphingomonas hankookensis TaxID=563996 RepID=A0ABR5Y7T8_9SPHN|nr:VVA0879 family protein [Sphingomonas hankookensis]KZE08620.1 hypothetical protein AVT10_08695 [Sphingomonas hankookensis]
MALEVIDLGTFRARCNAQKVPREDVALVCPVCGTVQSMRSLAAAGVPADKVETQIGFSCEGRWTGAGPADKGGRSRAANGRGCDWTLGGLFRIHELEVIGGDSKVHPMFRVATPEEAQSLAAEMRAGA